MGRLCCAREKCWSDVGVSVGVEVHVIRCRGKMVVSVVVFESGIVCWWYEREFGLVIGLVVGLVVKVVVKLLVRASSRAPRAMATFPFLLTNFGDSTTFVLVL